MRYLLALCLTTGLIQAQEASSGFDLRATLSGAAMFSQELTQAPRFGSLADGGYRAVFYPTWQLNDQWSISGAYQILSRPYSYDSSSLQGHGVKGYVTMAALTWGRIRPNSSITVRVGHLPAAFGSFPLRYDDMTNPVTSQPAQYGYYYAPITTLGLDGAQMDITRGKWDGRVQFSNSSPTNPHSLFAKGQFGNWTGGAGYTVRQGLRIGVSMERGPYLDSKFRFYFPGEADPHDLPAHAIGIDVQFALGHWNVQGELQKFVLPYRAIPTFEEEAGYVEVKRVLHPRWYVAVRGGYTDSRVGGVSQLWETTAGYRPNTAQLLKFSYLAEYSSLDSHLDKTFVVQLVTTLHPLSIATR